MDARKRDRVIKRRETDRQTDTYTHTSVWY